MANPILDDGSASPLSVRQTSTAQHHRIGTRGLLDDRSFRYARLTNATGLIRGNLAQAALPVANYTTQSGGLSTPGVSAGGIPIGATRITAVLGTTSVANQWEDGYITIESGTGLGQMYKILKHEASATNTVTLDLAHPVRTAIATGAVFTMQENPWADIIISTGSSDSMIVGVGLEAIPAATTAAPVFAWLQTWGPALVLLDASAHVVGSSVINSATAGSSAVAVENDILQRYGVAMQTITSNGAYGAIFLQIAP